MASSVTALRLRPQSFSFLQELRLHGAILRHGQQLDDGARHGVLLQASQRLQLLLVQRVQLKRGRLVKSRGSLNVPIPKHCGTLFLVPHCCVWVLQPSGESTAQAVPLHYNCVRTLGSYLAVMFNSPPSKLGNDFPLSQSSFRNSFPLEKKTAKHYVPLPGRRLSSPLAILSKVATVQQFLCCHNDKTKSK